jgi:Immunoglobulin domain/FG-GAP-like repeat
MRFLISRTHYLQTLLLASLSLLGINLHAATASAVSGQTVTFSVSAGGSAPFQYQWYKNGAAIASATGPTYVLSQITAANAGSYYATVANVAGSASSDTAVLTVIPAVAPSFTIQPAGATVVAGNPVTFAAAAKGTPSPTYQWKKNGVAISGATANSYTITKVSTASAGSYTVVATNSAGSATSNAAVLAVNTVPVFTTQPASKSTAVGASVTLVAAASGTPTPTYQWKKTGVAISGATASSYTISSVTSASAGSYTVVASNSAGSVTSNTATLTVVGLPTITAQPTGGKTINMGSPFTLTAAASGTGTVTYQWKKDGVSIPGATSSTYSVVSAAVSDSGDYTFSAKNAAGTVTSSTTTMTVLFTPADFNGNHQSDIVWQNTATNQIGLWVMNKNTVASTVTLKTLPANWQAVGTIVLNSTGQSNILLQNTQTGEVDALLMNGITVSSQIKLCTLAAGWQVDGSGDFNDDGMIDLLVENTQTGEVGAWLMDGATPTSYVKMATLSAGWHAVAAADFNGDGLTDIVIENLQSGQVWAWLMNGTSVGQTVGIGAINGGLKVVGAGDYNDDGMADILLQITSSGSVGVWIMNQTTQTTYLNITSPGASVQVANH